MIRSNLGSFSILTFFAALSSAQDNEAAIGLGWNGALVNMHWCIGPRLQSWLTLCKENPEERCIFRGALWRHTVDLCFKNTVSSPLCLWFDLNGNLPKKLPFTKQPSFKSMFFPETNILQWRISEERVSEAKDDRKEERDVWILTPASKETVCVRHLV